MIHKVKAGETLSAIASKYKTSVSAIQKANSSLIKNVNLIKVGWVLNIPETKPQKDYNAIGKQVETCLKEIENLDSFKKLSSML